MFWITVSDPVLRINFCRALTYSPTAPLTNLTNKCNHWKWGPEQDNNMSCNACAMHVRNDVR